MLYRYGKFLQEQGEQKSWKLRIGKQLPALAAAQGNLLMGIDNYLGKAWFVVQVRWEVLDNSFS